MKLAFLWGETVIALEVERNGAGWNVVLPDASHHRIAVVRTTDDFIQIEERIESRANLSPLPSSLLSDDHIQIEERSEPQLLTHVIRVPFATLEDGVHLSSGGRTFRFQAYSARTASTKSKASSGVLSAPMTGIVVDLMVEVGDRVEAYQALAVIEAMKIMSTLEAPFAGTVKAIHSQIKQQVTHGAPVIEISPDTESDKA